MSIYARKTAVSSERSRMEIERTLQRYGATQFAYASRDDKATIVFEMNGKRLRFDVPMRPRSEFLKTPSGRERSYVEDIDRAWNEANREQWRALALVVKAKLAYVESGAIFEEEFLAHIVLPNNQTYGQFAVPQIESAYERKKMPPLLGSGQ
jgi:hypothetical protein